MESFDSLLGKIVNEGTSMSSDGISTNISGITLYKQSSVRIAANKIIYVDPYELSGVSSDADYIFITHSHTDHFSENDIAKVIKSGKTILVVPEDLKSQVAGMGAAEVISVKPANVYEVAGLTFSTVPAYNIGKPYHPKEKGWVGYIIQGEKASYYFAGDIDAIPEMKNVKADIFFIPIGGTYTMNVEQAIDIINEISPKVVIPYHYGDIVGSKTDGEKFKSLLSEGIQCLLIKP